MLEINQQLRIGIMTRDNFLTARWNNRLTLALGVPALIYVVAVVAGSHWAGREALIGLAIIGAMY